MATATDSTLSPQSDAEQEGFFRRLINNFIRQGARDHSQLTFVVIGETGQGKSTLINSLAGEQIAKEGDEFDPETSSLDYFHLDKNGGQLDFWDTPGFGVADPTKEKETLEQMARDIKDVDLVLYCIRMDKKRWPNRSDTETIVKITEVFTKEIWSHCLFVLTFANSTVELLRPEGAQDSPAAQFSRLYKKWEKRIREQIKEIAGLDKDKPGKIRAVPVGSYSSKKGDENLWKLPDREDWHDSFWLEVSKQIRNIALPALLHLNQHRFVTVHGSSGKPYDRRIPLSSIMLNQLENESSEFLKYLFKGALLGGGIVGVTGSVVGGVTGGLGGAVAVGAFGGMVGAITGGAIGALFGTVAEAYKRLKQFLERSIAESESN